MRFSFWRHRRETDLEDEIQGHLQMAARDLRERGENLRDADRLSRREFGNMGLIKETTREMWGWPSLDRLGRDLRYGLRLMGRSKGFTAVAVLSLALGIGANTAIFTVINALMFRMLPVQNPEQLVGFGFAGERAFSDDWPYPTFEKFRGQADVFAAISATFSLDRSNISIRGPGGGLDAATVRVGLVSGTYFSMFGVQPVAGRVFTANDDRVPGAHPVAVISYDYWRRRFTRSTDVIGQTFILNGATYSILGVTRQGFTGDWIGKPTDIWIPIAMQSQVMLERPGLLANPNPPWVRIVARLQAGMPVQQAEAAAQVVYQQAVRERRNLTQRMLEEQLRDRIKLFPAAKGYSPQRDTFRQPLTILMITVGLVLLIACANIANLLLARSAARQREMAVRVSLGAGRTRILRQLLTESFLLAVMGGLLGGLFATWGVKVLMKFVGSGPNAVDLNLHPEARVLAFTAALSLLTGILFGLAPALRTSKVSLARGLAGCGVDSGTPRRFGLGKALVISQVALSLVLLIGAGLFVRTLHNLRSQDVGFDREHVLLFWTAPDHAGRQGAALARLYESVQERLSALPGVRSVSPTAFGVLAGTGGSPVTNVEGYTRKAQEDQFVPWSLVAPGFFDTVGIRRLLGRDFTARDTETTPRVAIINESMARYYFGDQSPVGRHFGMRRDAGTPIEIVGVVKDAKYETLREKHVKMIYIPYRQDLFHLYDMCVAVRTIGSAPGLTALVRDQLRSIDPSLPILKIDTPEAQLDDALVEERLIAVLSGFFGGLAVLLACLGLYGVMSYTAAGRTKEIGIRVALGATAGAVLGMVLKECIWLVAGGIAIGVPMTFATMRFIANRLFGVKPTDPATIVAAVSLIIAVATLAALLPARRASKVDPMAALRYE